EMTLFNHYSHGSVGSWIHGNVGGLEPLEPGWRRLKVEVVPRGPVQSAETTFHGPYGTISTLWRRDSDCFFLEVNVPLNSVAEVILPGEDYSRSKVIGSGRYRFDVNGI